MTRRPGALTAALAAIIGAVLGAGVTAAIQDAGGGDRVPLPPTSAPPATLAVEPSTGSVLLVWTPGGLPPGLDAAASSVPATNAVAVVSGGLVDLVGSSDADGRTIDEPPAGWAIPLDAVAVDPAALAAVLGGPDAASVVALGPGEALLGATSARLRRAGPGASLELRGGTVRVAAVVPDEVVGGAELAVDLATGAAIGVTEPEALLVAHDGARAAIEAAVAAAVPAGSPVRFRSPAETPYLRAGDAVLPQARVKDAFGEFAYRPAAGRDVEIDPAWVEANIGEATLPVLGRVRCHRALLPTLEAAFAELAAAGLDATVDPSKFAGCFVPRLVVPGGDLSRHSWGIALDLNWVSNPTSTHSTQDPRLIDLLERWGFGWGGRWLVADPAHVEYVSPPAV